MNLGLLKKWIIPSVGKTAEGQELTANDARRYFLLGTIKIVMNTVVADDNNELEAESDNEDEEKSNTLTVGGSQPDNEDDMEDYQSPDEEYSVSNEDGIAKIEKQTEQERTRIQLDVSKANNQAGISSVAELLKIGTEKGAGSTLSIKEAENIFNSEAAEEHEDDEALAALEELNENQERKVEKIEILKDYNFKK